MTKETLADYVVTIVSPLVFATGEVSCVATTDDMGVLLTLTVADEDFGKVIGRGGGVIQAVRKVVKAVAIKHKINANIKVREPLRERERQEVDVDL